MKQVVYVASSESKQIYIWQLDATGTLVPLQVVNVPGQPQPMIIHPNKNYLYVGIRPLSGVVSYRIQADGGLHQVGIAPLFGSPSYISTDRLGKYLFSASYSSNCISVSQIGHDLAEISPIHQICNLVTPHSVNIDPANQCLMVPCLKEDCIRLFKFSLDGKLLPHSQEFIKTVSGAGPRHMAFHPNGKYAYCVNELNGTVNVLAISKNRKTYSLIQTINIMPANFTGKRWAADIHITPNSRFLYISERTASIITILSVSTNGSSLSVLDYHSTELQPRSFNIDHSGRFLISLGQKSNYIAVNAIDESSGKLSTIERYLVGKGPIWVVILLVQ